MKDDAIRVGLLLGVIVLAFALGPALANSSMRRHQLDAAYNGEQ